MAYLIKTPQDILAHKLGSAIQDAVALACELESAREEIEVLLEENASLKALADKHVGGNTCEVPTLKG